MAQSSRKAWCSVPGCSCGKQRQPYLSFHGFPSDAARRRRWTAALGRDRDPGFAAAAPRRGSAHVCSRHFAPGDLYTTPSGRVRLRPGAVPTRFAWNRWGEAGVGGLLGEDGEVGVLCEEEEEEEREEEEEVGGGGGAGGLLGEDGEVGALCEEEEGGGGGAGGLLGDDGDVGALCEEEEERDEEEGVPSAWAAAPDHDYAKLPTPPPAKDPAARIRELERKNVQLEARLRRLTLEMSRFWAGDEERFGFHTRFPDEEVFKSFWESFPGAAAGSKRAPYPSVQVQTPPVATREVACQTEGSGALHMGTVNLGPSWRTKARARSTEGQGVACSKPPKRRRRRWQQRRHYDTDSSDSSSSDAPPPDHITDWNTNSESLRSGPDLHITDSTSQTASQVTGQVDTWVEVTVKDEDEEEDISWVVAGEQEETEEQKERKLPVSISVSSAASPLSDARARSETPSPGPGSISPTEEAIVKKEKPRLWVNSGAS